MNTHGRFAVWLQEHFSFFNPEPLVKDLLRFLDGKMLMSVLSVLSCNDENLRVAVESDSGKLLYEKKRGNGRHIIEQVEFIPCRGKGFAFTVVDNELSVLRSNGSDRGIPPLVFF